MKNWLSFLTCGMLVTVAPATAEPHLCEGSNSDVTHIEGGEIVDDVLVVFVDWSPQRPLTRGATLELLDRSGNLASSTAVVAEPGRMVSYPVTPGADFFVTQGYWFTIRLTDRFGGSLAESVPILVAPCSREADCNFRLVEGVGTDTLAMGSELFELLDQLETVGSVDLLNDALSVRPDLGPEIFWVGDQMIRLQAEDGSLGCVCRWNAYYGNGQPASVQRLQGEEPTPNQVSSEDWETTLSKGSGVNFYMAGQMVGGSRRTVAVERAVSVSLGLRCRRLVDPSVPPAVRDTDLSLPMLRPCEEDCRDAKVYVTAEAQSETAANAWVTSHHGAKGEASASTSFFLDQQSNTTPVFTASAATIADRLPGDFELQTLTNSSGSIAGSWLQPGPWATATFETSGHIEMCLAAYGPATDCPGSFTRVPGSWVPWAYGCSSTEADATLVGEATCAVEPIRTVSLSQGVGHTQDGLVIVPWNP